LSREYKKDQGGEYEKQHVVRSLAVAIACVSSSAYALVGGSLDANLTTSPWAGVGAVTINGGVYSGALLDSQHVLTAAHVVGGQVGTPGNVGFTLNVGGAATHVYSAVAISVYGGYSGTAPSADGVWHDDLAIITLSAPVAGVVPTYDLYTGSLADHTVTFVGYGGGGDGLTGVTSGPNATIKRTGQNNVDMLLADDDGGTADEVFVFDFDGPTKASNVYGADSPANLTLGAEIEAQFAGGDSGSPVFVDDNGVWKIAGVATFNGGTQVSSGSSVLFGSVGGGTIVAPYQSWIQTVIAAPVPEPEVWGMLVAGLGMVGVACRRRILSS
jgi:V8-like Glu-specific endopeptidase